MDQKQKYLITFVKFELSYLLYGTTALEELWPPYTEGFFI